MNNDPDMPISPDPAAPVSGGDHSPDRPHGLDPRALLEAVAEPTGTPGVVPPLPAPQPDELASSFPQLEIGECLGRGGMGVVYRAKQRSLNRVVALKLLAPERGHDPAFAERFAREAQALAKLNHPNIVTIHDFGEAGGFYYLLMEFVDGVNLRQAMQAGRFTPEQALAIVPPVCEALQYAHTQGIVHRDIKPENLLLDKDGRIKIADFGIAKMMQDEESDLGLAESQPAGTPRYMAPEQRDAARRTDHRTDIYSLGVVLYELLTGELPGAQLEPPSRRVQIDVRLDEIVLRALEAEPDRRYQTAVEMRTRIEELGSQVTGGARTSDVTTPAGAAPVPSAASAAPPKLIRSGQSTVTTPERLATAGGQFFAYRDSRRQLLLDDSRLTLAEGTATTLIPLTSIKDLSIGRHPRVVNPAGLDFISVTYEEAGHVNRLLITPYEGFFAAPADRNRLVYDWWATIHAAVVAATGRAPTVTPAGQLGTPRSSGWLVAMLMVPVLMGLVLLAGPVGLGFQEVLILLALGGLAIWWWRKPSADKPQEMRADASHEKKWLAGLLYALALVLTVLFAMPHYSVLGAGNIMAWTVGLPSPWITDILHVHSGGTQNRLREMHFDRLSFYCGLAALACWLAWLRLRGRHASGVLFEVVAPPTTTGTLPRIRWSALTGGWLAMASLSVIGALLVCVVMNFALGDFPYPPLLLLFALLPVSAVFLNALRLGLRAPNRSASLAEPFSPPPVRDHGCLTIFLVCLTIAAVLMVGMVFVWSASRLPNPPAAAPVAVEPAPVVTPESLPPPVAPMPPTPPVPAESPDRPAPPTEQLFRR